MKIIDRMINDIMKFRSFVVDPIEAFPKVEGIIHKLAWKCAQSYPVTFEEARSEAYLAFLKACADYKPERGAAFASWCYFWIWTDLKTWITKRSKDPLVPSEITEEMVGFAPETDKLTAETMDALEELSADAREIVSLLLETPAEIVASVKTLRQLVAGVKKMLIAKGRTKEQVDNSYAEIETTLRKAWAT
jgi:hypothetical protein